MNTPTTYSYEQKAWNLDELFPGINTPEVTAALTGIDAKLTDFAGWRPKLNSNLSAADFLAILQAYEEITEEINRLVGYAGLCFSADTQDQAAQNFLARMQQLKAESQNRALFFELWWKQVDEKTAVSLLQAAPDYRYWLETLRRQKPYTLSEPEERIINLKNANGRSALEQLYDSITNRYTFQLQVGEEKKALTRGELSTYFYSPEPELRAAAYQELNRVYENDAHILGQIYQAIVRDWHSENVSVRQFATPLAARNLANDIPDEVVATLLDVVQANASLFQRFFRLKANLLGVDKLRRCDLYAPVVKTEQAYSFEEAVTLVLDSLETFHPQLAQLARRVFDEDHLDSEVRTGKNSGAFCAPITPNLTPWVLQSYNGHPNDVATLAHELGHAIHFMLAEHHNNLTWVTSLPLAETASTFAELLLIDHLIAHESNPEIERTMLFNQMNDAYGTIMRQGYFALFEKAAHTAVHEGASVDTLCELYLENLQGQFGNAITVSSDFRNEWLAIPHFYSVPFYVYAYAFGQLLALSLYDQYQQEGEPFKARYLELLAAGGSLSPMAILQQANIDVNTASFWQGGFNVLARILDRLESVV